MSNTCGLCNKEYNKQYFTTCPTCGFSSKKELTKSEVVSNTRKCSLCEKEYAAVLPNCPTCLCPANKEVVSNTDKLQEIQEQCNTWINECEHGNSDNINAYYAVNLLSYTISQLEQAQATIQELKEFAEVQGNITINKMIDIKNLQAENEQLKADKQKYERALEYYADENNYAPEIDDSDDYNLGITLEIMEDNGQRARRVLSEVKGNG